MEVRKTLHHNLVDGTKQIFQDGQHQAILGELFHQGRFAVFNFSCFISFSFAIISVHVRFCLKFLFPFMNCFWCLHSLIFNSWAGPCRQSCIRLHLIWETCKHLWIFWRVRYGKCASWCVRFCIMWCGLKHNWKWIILLLFSRVFTSEYALVYRIYTWLEPRLNKPAY